MTPPERIEELLNEFGETLTDLPKAENYKDYGNRGKLLHDTYAAIHRAKVWFGFDSTFGDLESEAMGSFISYQSDVIEKLIKALETSKGMWDNLKSEVHNLMIKTPLWEDHYHFGYNGACMNVLDIMREISGENVSEIINR